MQQSNNGALIYYKHSYFNDVLLLFRTDGLDSEKSNSIYYANDLQERAFK